jgi:hypothetical protein
VLVAAANVGRDQLEDSGVGSLTGQSHPLYYVVGNLQLRIIDVLDADLPGALVDDYLVLRHRLLSFEFAVR